MPQRKVSPQVFKVVKHTPAATKLATDMFLPLPLRCRTSAGSEYAKKEKMSMRNW